MDQRVLTVQREQRAAATLNPAIKVIRVQKDHRDHLENQE
jgi:hypothetical protein